MPDIDKKVEAIDWEITRQSLNNSGYAIIENFLNNEQCELLIDNYNTENLYRKTVQMERHQFGAGEYKYYKYPLPNLIQSIRSVLYLRLVSTANLWMKALKMEHTFPETLTDLLKQCQENNQSQPTPLILKYNKGGFNTLHQDLYGTFYFPFQAALFLNEPKKDYTGGEFILTQQVPRAQSKAMVLTPGKGDLIIFTTQYRPVKGVRGYYRAAIRHGVSEVRSGTRHTLGIIFHDALK